MRVFLVRKRSMPSVEHRAADRAGRAFAGYQRWTRAWLRASIVTPRCARRSCKCADHGVFGLPRRIGIEIEHVVIGDAVIDRAPVSTFQTVCTRQPDTIHASGSASANSSSAMTSLTRVLRLRQRGSSRSDRKRCRSLVHMVGTRAVGPPYAFYDSIEFLHRRLRRQRPPVPAQQRLDGGALRPSTAGSAPSDNRGSGR